MWAALFDALWPSSSPPKAPPSDPSCSSEKLPGEEPAPEPDSKDPGCGPELDLTFMCDCTGSMGSYILFAQRNIRSIVERVAASERANVRFALVAYRDHPPQESSYITQIFPFTSEVSVMKGNVDTMSASGGGDGPEAVTAALHDTLHLPWRPNATKVAVLIADAPPHGLEPAGDGFPNGDPDGRDPLAIAREMAVRGIACYTVGCEPALGGYHFARDFMCTLAEITGGQAVALGSAALLAEVIVNGSAEEICLTQLQREMEDELASVQQAAAASAEVIDDDETVRRATASLQSKNVRSKQMYTDGGMKNSNASIWHSEETSTLKDAKAELCKKVKLPAEVPSYRMSARRGSARAAATKSGGDLCEETKASEGSYRARRGSARAASMESGGDLCEETEASEGHGMASTMNVLKEDVVSSEQVKRMFMKKKHKEAAFEGGV